MDKVSPLVLTVDSEQHAGIAHPHHVLSNAGKQESIVLAGDVHQGQIDGMNIGPVEVGLKIPEKNADRNQCLVAPFLPQKRTIRVSMREGLQNPRTTGIWVEGGISSPD